MTMSNIDLSPNSMLAFLLYWIPMTFCAYGYMVRSLANCRKDLKAREEWDEVSKRRAHGEKVDGAYYYSPTDKVGTLIGRGLVTIIPVANLIAAIFDLAPEVFYRVWNRLEKIFDQPIVPPRKE